MIASDRLEKWRPRRASSAPVESISGTIGLTLLLLSGPAIAELEFSNSNSDPTISGTAIFRLGYNGSYYSEDPRTESSDLFFEMIAYPKLALTEKFSLNAELRIETLRPATESRYFEDQGFFVRSLYANYEASDSLSFHAGKYTPSFAIASFATPGMFGNNYSKEIELIERIGVGGEYLMDTGHFGKHKLSANIFFEDTSFLSDSLGSSPSRGRKKVSDGGSSNTESFESFAVSLEGNEITNLPGFTYKLGYLHQARGADGSSDENGFSISAIQTFNFSGGDSLTLIGEFAPLWNYEGTRDNIIYTSAGLAYKTGPFTMIASGTYRKRDLESGGTFDDYSIQTSIEYDFDNEISVALAHEFTRDQNRDDRRIGFRLTKVLDW